MSLKNPRYMVTINEKIYNFLISESKNKKTSISKLIKQMIERMMDLQEDYYFSKIGDEAYERNLEKPFISSKELWQQCGLE